jgi:hypothetical protein
MKARDYWVKTLIKIADPVLSNLEQRTLKEKMPSIEGRNREAFTHLEALGRLLAGMAPWLESSQKGKEEELRNKYASMARAAIDAATDPDSPDYMNFKKEKGDQPVVDAAFLAHAIVRAPNELLGKLDKRVKNNLIQAFYDTREIRPYFCNWLLFSAMIEAALFAMGEEYDSMRVDFALKQHEQWYLGDGIYGDGVDFHWDYYNSFVIQPMLVDIIRVLGNQYEDWGNLEQSVNKRAQRYAAIQERLISPEGTFPPIGRSLVYRTGVFQLLAQMALQDNLPEEVLPAQVRCALTAVIKGMLEAPGTYDENGWLRLGFYGHQPDIAEPYIAIGSLYLCSTVFLPLGLSSEDEFWKGEDRDWTAKKLWSGANMKNDHALY